MQKPLVYIVLIGTPWIAEKWEEPLARHLQFYQLQDSEYQTSIISLLEWSVYANRDRLVQQIKESGAKRLHVLYMDDPLNAEVATTLKSIGVVEDTWLYALYFDAKYEGSEVAPSGWMWKKVQPRNKPLKRRRLMAEPYYLIIDRAKEIARILSRVETIDQLWLYGSLARAYKQGYGSARDIDLAVVTNHAESWVKKPGGREDGPYRTVDFQYLYVWIPEITEDMTYYISQVNLGQEFIAHTLFSEMPSIVPATLFSLMGPSGEPGYILTECEFNLVPPNPSEEWWIKFRELGFDWFFPESMVHDALRWNTDLDDFVADENFPGRQYLQPNLADYIFAGGDKPFQPTEHYLAWERGNWRYKAYYNREGNLVPSWDRSLIGMKPPVYRS